MFIINFGVTKSAKYFQKRDEMVTDMPVLSLTPSKVHPLPKNMCAPINKNPSGLDGTPAHEENNGFVFNSDKISLCLC